jgi:hypothetical protein
MLDATKDIILAFEDDEPTAMSRLAARLMSVALRH